MFVMARLREEQLAALKDLEAREGIKLVAMKDLSLEPDLVAANQLEAIQALENMLGVCLLAVR